MSKKSLQTVLVLILIPAMFLILTGCSAIFKGIGGKIGDEISEQIDKVTDKINETTSEDETTADETETADATTTTGATTKAATITVTDSGINPAVPEIIACHQNVIIQKPIYQRYRGF